MDTPYRDFKDKRDGMSDLTSPSAKKPMPDFNVIDDSDAEENNFRLSHSNLDRS